MDFNKVKKINEGLILEMDFKIINFLKFDFYTQVIRNIGIKYTVPHVKGYRSVSKHPYKNGWWVVTKA